MQLLLASEATCICAVPMVQLFIYSVLCVRDLKPVLQSVSIKNGLYLWLRVLSVNVLDVRRRGMFCDFIVYFLVGNS